MHKADSIRAVAFDLDGTLIDTLPDLAAAVNSTLSVLEQRTLPEERVAALVGNGIEALVEGALRESAGDAGAGGARVATALELFRRQYLQCLFKRGRVYPGVIPALRSLAERGLPLGCITNKLSLFSLPLLDAAGLSQYLAFTFCADRAEDRKPSPSLLLKACSKLAIAPAELLYVGDSALDLAAARAAGCKVIAVTYGYGNQQPGGRPRPQDMVGNLTELPGLLAVTN